MPAPIQSNQVTHNLFFHPLKEKKSCDRVNAVLLHLFLTVVTLGLWQLPFWIMNCKDGKKPPQITPQKAPESVLKVTKLQGLILPEKIEQPSPRQVPTKLPEIVEEETIHLKPLTRTLEPKAENPPVISEEIAEIIIQPKKHPEIPLEEQILTITPHPIKEVKPILDHSERTSIQVLGLKEAEYFGPRGKLTGMAAIKHWLNIELAPYGFTVKSLDKDEHWKDGSPFWAIADVFEDGFYAQIFDSHEEKVQAAFEIFTKNGIPALLDASDMPWGDAKSIYTYLGKIKEKYPI